MLLGTTRPELNTYAGMCFTEFMRLIYLSRPDIQKRFSLNDVFSRTILLAWYHTQGYRDIRMFATDLPEPQWSLLNNICDEIGTKENHSFTKMQAVLWLASSLAKENFDLNLLDDRLRIELLVAASIPKPQGISCVPPSHQALLFANSTDTTFTTNVPIPICQLLSSVWRARKDVKNVFPCDSNENTAALVLWFLNHGLKELDLSTLPISSIETEYLLSPSFALQTNANITIPRILHQIWCSSTELQLRYNLDSLDERQQFYSWFKERGIQDYGLSWLFEQAPFSLACEPVSYIEKPMATPQRSNALLPGVNVIGNAQGNFGMSQHAIMTALAIRAAGTACAIVDMSDASSTGNIDATQWDCSVVSECLYSVNIAAFTPAMLPHEFAAIGIPLIEQCHNIYYGNWEYPQYPQDHIAVIDSFDEIWAPSRFTLTALKNNATKPLHHVPLAISVTNSLTHTRSDFALPDNIFLFVHTFDYHSGIMRKNPSACIQAFLEAFPQGSERVGLVIKAMNIGTNKTEGLKIWHKLKETAQIDPRIIIIEQKLSRREADALVNLCDAYISLHRAEGFGLAIAEAMLMAKPAIVTNYSGNTDFTLPSNSCLVNAALVCPPQSTIERLGVETTWGEPDTSQAAWYMRKLFSQEDFRAQLGQTARQYILENHSPAVIGKIIRERLEKLL